MKASLIQAACIVVYLLVGFPIIKRAYRNIRMGDFFSEHILLVIASAGAIALNEWHEAISVIVLYRIGEYLQGRALEKSRKKIDEAINAASEKSNEDIRGIAEEATMDRAETDGFIRRFAQWYTPVICVAALVIIVIPPLLGGNFAEWFERAMVFLVTSCPCALVISIPMSFFGGISNASGKGILFKSESCLEKLAKAGPDAINKDELIFLGEEKDMDEAIRIAKKTMGIVKMNIVLALGAKALVIVLALFGISSIFLAEFADVGVCIIAILNSMRCLR